MWLQSLAAELAITLADPEVWFSIGLALLLGGVCLLLGTWVARTVGLLRSDAPAGETLGVGLSAGLMVLAAWWAAVWSGGRSSFTPVAVGFAIALALAVAGRARRRATGDAPVAGASAPVAGEAIPTQSHGRRSMIVTVLAGAVFVVAVALLNASTMALSPRDGVQPLQFRDAAFYAILGRDLAATGTETTTSPSGFTDLPGLPAQTWYHWGELWLAAAVITTFGTAPLAARYIVVLPALLLAAAALTGTLVRRMTGSTTPRAYLFGFLACLFLAPISLIPGPFFSSLLVGMIHGIINYGLAAVAALLALYGLAVLGTRGPSWALGGFAGSAAAFILPAHVVIALLGLVGVGSVWTIRIAQSGIAMRRLPYVPPIWRRTVAATALVLLATVSWGLITGHGLGGASSTTVSPFNTAWSGSIAVTTLGAGAFFAIPVAWLAARKEEPARADIYLGTMMLLVAGAVAWGARLGDFNMFYFFLGGIAIFATPVAAIAVWSIWMRLRRIGHARLGAAVLMFCVAQMELGVGIGIIGLQGNGPDTQSGVPLEILAAIKALPAGAELAYACRPFGEVSFATPNLLAIDAHTGRGIVPMCFEADVFGALSGAQRSAQTPNAAFARAPQHVLYPNATAHPSSAAVAAFLKDHGIDYIYADALHPNTLVPAAVPIATSGSFELLRVP